MNYFLVGVSLFVISQVHAGLEDDITSCLQIFNPETFERGCCENLESLDEMFDDDLSKCDKEDSKDQECGYFECMLRERGLLKDGKVDDGEANKQLNKLAKDFPKEKTIIDRVRRECLAGKYESYPLEDELCPAMKYFICTYMNVYLACDSWKEDEFCSNVSQDVKKCKAALDKS